MDRVCRGKGGHTRSPVPLPPSPAPHAAYSIPVFFAIWQQGWALSPRAFCANVGVPAGHHAGREVVLWETRPGGGEGVKGHPLSPRVDPLWPPSL